MATPRNTGPMPVAKKYINQARGINTEAPLTEFPEGFVIDEVNMEVLMDGSHKRRPGLIQEETGTGVEFTIYEGPELPVKTYLWRNAANLANANLLCVQVGRYLHVYFYGAGIDISNNDSKLQIIDLYNFQSAVYNPDGTQANPLDPATLAFEPVTLAAGNGYLFLTGKYIKPQRIEYDVVEQTLIMTDISLRERDFIGIKDDIGVSQTPTTLTDAHRYNLWNRGWVQTYITQYFTDKGVYPAKNMIQRLGMRRYDDVSVNTKAYAPEEGIKEFSSNKLQRELFGEMSAPQGHLILDPFDTRYVASGVAGNENTILTITNVNPIELNRSDWTIRCTVTTNPAVSVNDEVRIDDMQIQWMQPASNIRLRPIKDVRDLSGVWTVTAIAGTGPYTFDFFYRLPYQSLNIDGPDSTVVSKGTVTVNATTITNVAYGVYKQTRFRYCHFYQGRLWYGGCDEKGLQGRIYFSQVADTPEKYGSCLTQADPSATDVSDPIATDGGYITIPDMAEFRGFIQVGNSLLVLGANGIWALGPGELGFFSPTSYTFRKISDIGIVSPESVVVAENTPMFCGKDGIYAIAQDPNSGFLSAQNISSQTINRLYMSIDPRAMSKIKATYDDLDKRVIFLFGGLKTQVTDFQGAFHLGNIGPDATPESTSVSWAYYQDALVYDLRLQAFTRWKLQLANPEGPADNPTFNQYVETLFVQPNDFSTDRRYKFKFFCTSGASIRVYDMRNTTTYRDAGFSNPAYIISGPDSIGDSARHKTAPYIHCYFRQMDNAACLMQPIWDWSLTTTTGKVGNPIQVYREFRPRGEDYKLVVTKNKIRGHGRNLYLAFNALPDKPMWLEGWQTEYRVVQKL